MALKSMGRFKSAFDKTASQALVQSQFQQKKSTYQCAYLRHSQYSKIRIILIRIKKKKIKNFCVKNKTIWKHLAFRKIKKDCMLV